MVRKSSEFEHVLICSVIRLFGFNECLKVGVWGILCSGTFRV